MEGSAVKQFLATNLRIKVLALAFAIALWFFVAGQSDNEVGVLVPIVFKDMPKSMVMTSSPPEDAEVRVGGPKFIVNNISPSQILVEIDLAGVTEGLNTIRLTPKDVTTPTGISVTRIRPSSIDIRMENLVSVTLPVKVRLTGKPADGFKVVEITASPKTVDASGTRKELKTMSRILTKPVDIDGLDATAYIKAPLDVPSHELRSISAEAVAVTVKIEPVR